MSTHTNKYLDLTGLTQYDDSIKDYVDSQGASSSYKTILLSSDGKTLYFYRKANATLSDTADFSLGLGTAVTLNGSDLAGSSGTMYAPTTAGTSNQVLVSNGSGAPSWESKYAYTPTIDNQNHKLVLTRTAF